VEAQFAGLWGLKAGTKPVCWRLGIMRLKLWLLNDNWFSLKRSVTWD
jgi:hypothetical protein